jgi:hypothetical protein
VRLLRRPSSLPARAPVSADAETGGQNSVKTGMIDAVLNRR